MLVRGEMLCACSVSAQRKASKQLHNACALCMCICVCACMFCEIYAVGLAMRRRLFTALSTDGIFVNGVLFVFSEVVYTRGGEGCGEWLCLHI